MQIQNESQRALAAGRLASGRPGAPSQGEAAQRFNVSRRSVQSARQVLARGVPGLIARVEEGTVRVSAAAHVSTLPPDRQRRLIARGPDAVREAATAIRRGFCSPDD